MTLKPEPDNNSIPNEDKLEDLLSLTKAKEVIGITGGSLRKLLDNYGVQHFFGDNNASDLRVSYNREKKRDLVVPSVPFLSKGEHKNKFLTRNVVLDLREAKQKLIQLGQDQQDGYVSYRLAEVFLMNDAHPLDYIVETTHIPKKFVLDSLETLYSSADSNQALWKGIISEFYIDKSKYGKVVSELKDSFAKVRKFFSSYSTTDIASMFRLRGRLVRAVVDSIKGLPGYEGVFADEKNQLHVPKELIYASHEKRPLANLIITERRLKGIPELRDLLLTEKEIRGSSLLGCTELSKRFDVSISSAGYKLKWLRENGYQSEIKVSYLNRVYLPERLLKSDVFVLSVFNDSFRREHYYTNMDIRGKFPHITDSAITQTLNKYKKNADSESGVCDGFGNTSLVRKELIDKDYNLGIDLWNLNVVMDPNSDYICSPDLRKHSSLSDRGLRNRLTNLRNQYSSDIFLARHMYYVSVSKLHDDPEFREALCISNLSDLPPPNYNSPRMKIFRPIETEPLLTELVLEPQVVKEPEPKPKTNNITGGSEPKNKPDYKVDQTYLASLADTALYLSESIDNNKLPEGNLDPLLTYVKSCIGIQALDVPEESKFWPALRVSKIFHKRLEIVIDQTSKYLTGDSRYGKEISSFWSYLSEMLTEIKEKK